MKQIRKSFKERLQQEQIITAPGVYDALTAILCEQAGFEAVYLTGAGVSYTMLGKSDIGLVTMSEMASRAAYICDVVQVPVIADGDTGYGNPFNVIRTIREYERAGVTAIQLEDQDFPKKCGHLSNKTLIPAEEMAAKIKAALDARTDDNFLIIARTDAIAVEGFSAAIERAQLYAEIGADIIFVEAPQSYKEMAEIAKSIDKPLLVNQVEGGKTPLLPIEQLQHLGYKLAIFPNSVTRVVAKTVQTFYQSLIENGSTQPWADKMLTFNELNGLLGIEQIRQLEQIYSSIHYKNG